jgi:hypothetical protein
MRRWCRLNRGIELELCAWPLTSSDLDALELLAITLERNAPTTGSSSWSAPPQVRAT